MADSKISAMTAVTTPTGASEFAVNEGGTSKKMTLTQIKDYVAAGANSSTAAQTAFTSDTYLSGSLWTIDPARVVSGSCYKLEFDVTKTAAGTATATMNLRLGTAGTTADTSRCLFTFPSAQTAAIDNMRVTILSNFRSVGSGTSAVIASTAFLIRSNTTTGFLSTSATTLTLIKVTSSGFDSTTPTKIGLSINAGASAAWTITTVQSRFDY